MEMNELFKRCMRVFHISRKPTGAEFNKVAKITGLGMFLFGLIGFVISVVFGLI